jgi:hypothetical protein
LKLLPCATQRCIPLGALLPPSALFPEGEPALSARYVKRYKCHRCGKPREMPVARYNGLPELSLADFRRMAKRPGWSALDDLPTQDLEGAGMARGEAEDLFTAGFDTVDVHEIDRARGEPAAEAGARRLGLRSWAS